MIDRLQKTALCALHSSLYIEINPRVICMPHGLSNTQAIQAIEHYQKGIAPQDKRLATAI